MIYKRYAKQTEKVVAYLSMARHYEHATRLHIPKVKHAPTGLTQSLEDYLNDREFEINRSRYMEQEEAKKSGKPFKPTKATGDSKSNSSKPAFPEPARINATNSAPPAKGPPADLIDFFESIEPAQNNVQQQNYTGQFTNNPQPTGFNTQPNGFVPQQSTNPFGHFQQPTSFSSSSQPQQQPQPQTQFQTPIQTQSTGAGFGGYTPQPPQPSMLPQQTSFTDPMFNNGYQQQPQNQFGFAQPVQQPQQPQQQQQLSRQQTNPFRQTVTTQPTGVFQSPMPGSLVQSPPTSGTNPFAQQPTGVQQNGTGFQGSISNSAVQSPPFQQQPPAQQSQQLTPQRTGTNPFARASSSSNFPLGGIATNATGSTNPFRQSSFVNQQTGQGWQTGQQGTMGGLEQIPTVPIFPRPGQPQAQQPQQGTWHQ